MAQALGWDVIVGHPAMPAAGETVNGQPFSCPRGARTIGIHVGGLAGSSPTLKLQALDPVDKTTWRDVATYNLTTGATRKLDGIPQNQVTTIPVTASGSGVLRLVADQDQSGSPTQVTITFMMGGL